MFLSKTTISLLAMAGGMFVATAQAGSVRYVDDDAPPGGDGTSWDTAYRFVQDALAFACDPKNGVTEVRVGQGTYLPNDDKEKQVLQGLLNQRDKIDEAMAEERLFS